MKRNNITLSEIKDKITALKGREVNVTNNRGRNKIESYLGTIDNIYPAVFTIKSKDVNKTFSYSDVLCGNVKIDNL